jgi:hypothetical protein
LLSPVLALWIGHRMNNEPMTISIVVGTALILLALLAHNFFDRFFRALFNR